MRVLAVLSVLLFAPMSAVADDARRCTRAKARAIVEYVHDYYACFADAAAIGAEPDFACLTAAGRVVRARIAEASPDGQCPGTPDQVANAICVPFLGPGDPACRAATYRAVGWRLARRLACQAAGIRDATGPRPRCLDRVDAGFARRLARAEARGACGGDATQVARIADDCALGLAKALSCGNARLDYGELCEGASAFCSAPACALVGGACCATSGGCFQFDGPIEDCFFAGGLDVLPGFCAGAGCVDDVPITTTSLCCEDVGPICTAGIATTAAELTTLTFACSPGFAVVGTCGADGRCTPAGDPPVALPTTTTTTTTTSTLAGGTTTTTRPFPLCTAIGAACGTCGNGTCVQPLAGIPIGACVTPTPIGPCATTPPPCGADEVCVTAADECRALCF